MADDPLPLRLGRRIQHHGARMLCGLPAGLQVRLSGRPPVHVDGDTLAPDVQLLLRILERRRERQPGRLTLAQARQARRRLAALYAGAPEPVGPVRDLAIDAEVAVRARHYACPEPRGPRPLLVYFHGGGFTYGDLDTHDALCRTLCRHAGAHVLAVDYRLAPEHPFPAAIEDARAALSWAQANAATLGADRDRIGVGGDSAGGNLAAVVSQLAARDGGPAPVLQLLIYPATDFTGRRRSRDLFSDGFVLSEEEIDWFETNYLGPGRTDAHDPRASPLLADDLSGLAPALVVTAAFDPLRDEGEEYAQALRAAGTPATLRRFPGFVHGFATAAGISRSCRDALVEIAGATRAMFAAATSAEPGGREPEPASGSLASEPARA